MGRAHGDRCGTPVPRVAGARFVHACFRAGAAGHDHGDRSVRLSRCVAHPPELGRLAAAAGRAWRRYVVARPALARAPLIVAPPLFFIAMLQRKHSMRKTLSLMMLMLAGAGI